VPGPGFEWIGKEEEEEALEVLRARWMFRYGDERDPAYRRKVRSLEEMVEKDFAVGHALPFIEDAAQAFGGAWRGRRLGTVGRVGIYSFNISKVITAGDGGMLVTGDNELHLRAFGYHHQGHLPSRSGAEIGNRSLIGQNCRMNELTGAVLVAQYRRLDVILKRLRQVKKRLKARLAGVASRRINDEAGEFAAAVGKALAG
jgi:dTDP-4-amino-4,6-dideoxygalactose transaminase